VFSEFRRQQPRTADELIREARLVNGTRPAGVQEAEAVPDALPSDWRLF
jgi:hypothetical protein